MRFLSTLLLCTWGFLSLLGNAGIHAFAEHLGVCCVRTDDGAGAKSDCHHDGCVFCLKRATSGSSHQSQASDNSGSNSPTDQNAPHDADNCHLCDWLAKCQSQTLSFVCVIAEAAFEFRHVDVQKSLIAVETITAVSRGPPMIG